MTHTTESPMPWDDFEKPWSEIKKPLPWTPFTLPWTPLDSSTQRNDTDDQAT